MADQSVDFAVEMVARWMTFALDFALSGDLTQALDRAANSQDGEQSDQTALENLFWD